MTKATAQRYIVRKGGRPDGEPMIEGTRVAVRNLVLTWRHGVSPEEMPQHYPDITLAQVFAALSYFSDNQDEINGFIERNRTPKEQLDPLVRDR